MDFEYVIKYYKEVNGLIYKTIETDSEVSQCHDIFHNSFLKDEPITKNFRDKSKQSEEELAFWDTAFFYDVIKQGVSLIVVDPTKEGRPVIGMRLSSLEKRKESLEEEVGHDEQENSKHPSVSRQLSRRISRHLSREPPEIQSDISNFSFYTRLVVHILDQAGTAKEIFEQNSHFTNLYYMVLMTVNPEYRGRGIATSLVESCFEVAQMLGCDSAFVTATSPYTAKIFRKLDMTQFRELKWKSISFEGSFPCENKDMGSESVVSFVKSLKKEKNSKFCCQFL